MRLICGLALCMWYAFFLCIRSSAQETVCAIPPAPKPVAITQPDGTVIKLIAKGNPFLHWQETTDGYTVVKNSNGVYEYAIKEQGKLKPGGIRAVDPDSDNARARREPLNIEKHLKPDPDSSQQVGQFSAWGSNARSNQIDAGMPSSGNLKVLCILIEYPDLKRSFSRDNFVKLMNGPLEDGRLSFAEFYAKSSFGKLNMQVDIAGWYKAENNYTHYSNSAGSLVAEAVSAADQDGVDFTRYDNDKDGVVDGIIVVHAGPGGEEGGSSQYIWSHMSYISRQIDGVYVRPYCINPEVRNTGYGKNGMVGVGIFAHEFGHLLGLPDLYDTDGDSEGIGEWGLMGSGSWLGMENMPAGFSAWSKEQLGWIKPLDITDNYQELSLRPANEFPDAYKIRTANPDEYFLLENRQQEGIDSELRGHGLAIWHINAKKTGLYPTYNSVNADADNKGVDLEEADGRHDMDNGWNRGDNTDLYPADFYQYNLFDYSTDPNSNFTEKFNATAFTGISIENIREAGKNLSFTYRRNAPDIGDDCATPAIALEGSNHTPKLNYFFEYTMPRDGTVFVSVDDPDVWVGGTVFRNCEEVGEWGAGTPVYLDGASKTESKHKIDFVKKGQKLIFFWEFNLGEIEDKESFNWNLSIETGGVAEQDSLALVAVYKKMGGANWDSKKNWLKRPVSSWEGVTVKGERVTALELFELKNSFPDEFYKLDALETLHLQSGDNLSGTLDKRMAGFKRLNYLNIEASGLEVDFIDKLSAFTEIREISIRVHKIKGLIPENIGSLTRLTSLSLSAESFKSTIPEKLGSLSSLTSLTLNGEIHGVIPESLGKAAELRFIDLSSNKLSGKIPESFSTLNNLEYLNLENNQLSGAVQAGLFNLPFLHSLFAGHNQLESIPENLFSSESLEFINLSHNKIQGGLPQSVSSEVPMDIHVYLDHNQLSGKVPDALKNVTFWYLNLSHNQLEGVLPEIEFLEGLDISYNRFNGLPDLTGDSDEYYKLLYCQHNHLSFDDLLPNMDILFCNDCDYEYEEEEYDPYQQFRPQDTVNLQNTQGIAKGASYTIELGIDAEVKDNKYHWFKGDKLVKTTKVDKLVVEDFSAESAGSYRCEVSNGRFNDFNLYYEGIELKLGDKKEQKITIAAVEEKKYGDPAFRLKTESTGLKEMKFGVFEGPVQMNGDTVNIKGAGKARIRVYNEGNDQFNPAEAFVEFNIDKARQKINYEVPSEKTYADESFLLNVNASSQLPVALTLKEGYVDLNGKLVTITGAGDVKIIAKQEGSDNFYPADPVEINFTVAKAAQQLSVSDIKDQTFGAPAFTVEAVSSQGLPVKLEALTDNINVEGNLVTILKAGEASLKVSQPGDANIKAAEPVIRSFAIHKAPQVLYFQQIEDKQTTDEPFQLEAYSNQALPVSYRIIDGEEFIKLEGNVVTILDIGSVQIEAYQEGDENHEAAESMQRGFTINDPNRSAQTLLIQTDIPDTVQVMETYTFQIEVSSDLEPEITVEGPAELQGDQLTFLKEGKVRVIVKQTGSDKFNAAPTIVKEYVVNRASQQITYTPIEDKVYGEAFKVDFKASSGLPVSFLIEGPATINENTVTLTGTGTVKLIFYQEGNDMYMPVEENTVTFEVARASQVIDFQFLPASDTSYYLQSESSSRLPVSYELKEGKGEIRDDILYVNESGSVTVIATQEGNKNYLPAEPVSRTMEVKLVTGIAGEVLSLIRIYPNPSQGVFYMARHDGMTFNTEVKVYNGEGKEVLGLYWKDNAGEIDLTGKPQGIYFVRFTYEGELLSVPVILKW